MASYSRRTVWRWQRTLAPYRRPAPRPDPTRSALLVIDLQEYFAELAGPVLDPVNQAAATCRARGLPVIFTQHGHADPARDGGMLAEWWGELIREGSPEHRLLASLDRRPGDPIVRKTRYDAFHATELAELLDSLGVDDLALAGVMTNLCVETTARAAMVRDCRVRVLLDACATADDALHLAALTNLAFGFAYVQTTAEWLAMLG